MPLWTRRQRHGCWKVGLFDCLFSCWHLIVRFCHRNMTDVFLHLIQPKFRSIFGEHYYRYFRRIVEIFNIFCNFCPQNPVLQPTNQRSKCSGQWSPRCTAPPPTTRWWCRPTCFSIPTKKIFTSGKSFFPWYKLKHFQRNVVKKSTKYSWDAFLSAQHRGSLTRVGSDSVAGFFSLLMWLWVYIKIFDLFFFVAITFCCLWL